LTEKNINLIQKRYPIYTFFSGFNIIQAGADFLKLFRFYLDQEKKKRSEYDEIFNHY
jgi:hypothetical protein